MATRLDEIEVPVTDVHGTEDSLLPFGNATFMGAILSGARPMVLARLEGAGHGFTCEESWISTVRDAVASVIDQVSAQ